jgi:PAS domain S-box-containing protein
MKQILKAGFFLKIILPALLAITLFVLTVFVFIIPAFERNAINQKKNMLHELTNTAWSILQKYQTDEKNGLFTRDEAQKKAISEIEALRYGSDKKDYFWITDMTPVMIMHPYVQELTGKPLKEFADPDGKRIFLEARSIVMEHEEGFMNYKWQFMDQPGIIVPKLSFVKKFEPWNWIVGTGIYIDDVENEISQLTNHLLLILTGIILIISLMIFYITFQSLKIENERTAAEMLLHESREKYKSLIESSTEGIILLLNSKISYANAFIQKWLKYNSDELERIDINKLFTPGQDINFENIKKENRVEVRLNKKDGTPTFAILTALPVKFADKEGVLLTFRDTSEHQTIKQEREYLKSQISTIFKHSRTGYFRFSLKGDKKIVEFNQSIVKMLGYKSENELKKIKLPDLFENINQLKILLSNLKKQKALVNQKIRLRKYDQTTIENKISLFIVEAPAGNNIYCDGIIEPPSANKLNNNLHPAIQELILSLSQETQSANRLSTRTSADDALAPLTKSKDQRENDTHKTNKDAGTGNHANSLEFIREKIKNCQNTRELADIRSILPQLVKPMLSQTGSISTITEMTSGLNDLITYRIIENCIKEHGTPPVPFTFFVYGSAGRHELVFNSDQDNAIIYDNNDPEKEDEIHHYFVALGKEINRQLHTSGLVLCSGNYMAGNPKWCQSLTIWQDYFADWIVNAEPENILNFSVMFDFRHVYGKEALFEKLQNYVHEILDGRTAFFYLLAKQVTMFKPPLNVFGNITTDTIDGQPDSIDLKKCISPIAMFARIYALRNKIQLNRTAQRLQALKEMGVLSVETAEQAQFHFNFLMQLRFKQQITKIENNEKPGNALQIKNLNEIEQHILKKVFSQMNSYSEKISAEFMSAYRD